MVDLEADVVPADLIEGVTPTASLKKQLYTCRS